MSRDAPQVATTIREDNQGDYQLLIDAIQTGDISDLIATIRVIENKSGSGRLIELINQQTDEEGNFLVHQAVKWGNPLAVRCLVQHGAAISKRNSTGLTALELAVNGGSRHFVRFLMVECGANPAERSLEGQSAFSRLVSRDRIDVDMLICLIENYDSKDTLWLYKLLNLPGNVPGITWVDRLSGRLSQADNERICNALIKQIHSRPYDLIVFNLLFDNEAVAQQLGTLREDALRHLIFRPRLVEQRVAFLAGKTRSDSIRGFFSHPNFDRNTLRLIFDRDDPGCSPEKCIAELRKYHSVSLNILKLDDLHRIVWDLHSVDELSRAKYLLVEALGVRVQQMQVDIFVEGRTVINRLIDFVRRDNSISVADFIKNLKRKLIQEGCNSGYRFIENPTRHEGLPFDTVARAIAFLQAVCGLKCDIHFARHMNQAIDDVLDGLDDEVRDSVDSAYHC